MVLIETADGARHSSEWQCSAIAMKLSRFLTVHSLSEQDSTIKALTQEDLADATFIDAGRRIKTRSALNAALHSLKVHPLVHFSGSP